MQQKKSLKDIIGWEVKGIEGGKEWELGFDSLKKKKGKKSSSVCTPTQTEEFIILRTQQLLSKLIIQVCPLQME